MMAKQTPDSSYNGWGFARDLSNNIFALINSGQIFVAFALLVLCVLGLMVYKVPGSELARLIRDFLTIVNDTWALVFLLIATNLGWPWLMRRQQRIYEREIDRLAKLRSELMHGQENIQIKQHRSSDGEQKESYAIGTINGDKSEET